MIESYSYTCHPKFLIHITVLDSASSCHENFGLRENWFPGSNFSWKIGSILKILVLQWSNFPCNIGPGDHFFQGKLVRETIFSWNIGPGPFF